MLLVYLQDFLILILKLWQNLLNWPNLSLPSYEESESGSVLIQCRNRRQDCCRLDALLVSELAYAISCGQCLKLHQYFLLQYDGGYSNLEVMPVPNMTG